MEVDTVVKLFLLCSFVFIISHHVVCFTELLCLYCAVYSDDIIFVLWCLTEIKPHLIYLIAKYTRLVALWISTSKPVVRVTVPTFQKMKHSSLRSVIPVIQYLKRAMCSSKWLNMSEMIWITMNEMIEIMIQLCSGITSSRLLNWELYAQRLQKLIYRHLLTGCFMKISLQSLELNVW